MKISIITLFPEMVRNALNVSIIKRAQEKGRVEINIVDHRQFGLGQHQTVDDKPYGGGAGMILKVDVLKRVIDATRENIEGEKVILMDPQGIVYSQSVAEDLSLLTHIILVCGHYEGVDERIREYVDMEISIGDYVLTGGELPAMVIADSITRLVPGVLKKENATTLESHSLIDGVRLLEGPQYTRPAEFDGKKVPDIYLSGDPKKIMSYKKQKAHEKTITRRPDLAKIQKV